MEVVLSLFSPFFLKVSPEGAAFSHGFNCKNVRPHKTVPLIKTLPPERGGDNFTTPALQLSGARILMAIN